MYCGHARLCVCPRPHATLCTDPDVAWGSGRGCPLVVHYWADLQLVHGLRCYGNITWTRNVNEYMACTHSVPSWNCHCHVNVEKNSCLVEVVITTCNELCMFLFSTVCDFGSRDIWFTNKKTEEWICAKFTGKTCVVPQSRSKIKVTRDENALYSHHSPAATEWNALTTNTIIQQQTGPFHRCRGVISPAYSLFSKTSLALFVAVSVLVLV